MTLDGDFRAACPPIGPDRRSDARKSAISVGGRWVWRGLALALLMAGLAAFGAETVHEIRSPLQAAPTQVRVFTPDDPVPPGTHGLLLILPVEAGSEHRWGDPSAEVRRLDLANRHGLVVAIPTFSDLPWYADHPSDPQIQQERYLLEDVIPAIADWYRLAVEPDRTFLVGFSKSGWGAWSLLLRHPDRIARAAAWDAPVMQAAPDRYGMGPIFGTVENFKRYRIVDLIRSRAELLRLESRLVLTGYFDSFRVHHQRMHALLTELRIPHVYRDGPARRHHWESGWLRETVALLVERDP